jgi:hypothetical protein
MSVRALRSENPQSPNIDRKGRDEIERTHKVKSKHLFLAPFASSLRPLRLKF